MTPLLVLKAAAEQLGFFDQVVPVKGGTRKDGVYVKPHFARRRKKDRPPKTDEPPVQAGLFDDGARESRYPHAPYNKPRVAQPQHPPKPVKAAIQRDYGLPFEQIPIPDYGAPASATKAQRRKLNQAAMHLLQSGQQSFSPEEQTTLKQYSGRGGCGDSLNEFYTRPDVAAAMWKALNTLDIFGGNVLEPSCGTGVFMATAPTGVHVTGVELDATSAKIAGMVNAPHESVNASLENFAVNDSRQFDAVIGNAPFGLRGTHIKDDKKHLKTAEQYCLDTAIDKTRDNGIVAMIVPTGIMDAKSTRAFRQRLLRKATFLGAMRLPNTAFAASHTEVTSDIVVFRARPQAVAGALGAVPKETLEALGVWDDAWVSGDYFAGRGKDHIFGRQTAGWRAQAGIGNDITVEGSMAGVAAAVSRFANTESASDLGVDDVLKAVGDDQDMARKVRTAACKQPYQTAQPGASKTVDGITYVLQGEPPRWHRVGTEPATPPEVDAATDLAARLDAMFAGNETQRTKERDEAIQALDAYVAAYGVPSASKDLVRAAQHEPALWRLIGAVNRDGSYSDMVTGRIRGVDNSDFAVVAGRLALEQDGFTADEVAAIWTGGDRDAALDHLFASSQYAVEADGQTWTTLDAYLTGDLWPKLDAMAEQMSHEGLTDAYRAKYGAQSEALTGAIDPALLEDVEVTLADGWIPEDAIAAYFNAGIAEWRAQNPDAAWAPNPFEIHFADGIYTVSGGLGGRTKLLSQYLNRTGVKKDDWPVIEDMNERFKTWLLGSEYRDRVEDLYNRKFRGFAQKLYSDAPIDIPGMRPPFEVNAYHYAGLRWALDAKKGIIADDVGLGKTARGLMLARLAKLNGRADKPMIVVPKSVLANWTAEADTWFPGARVLTIGESYTRDKNGELVGKTDSKAERDRKFHALSQNDYDFVFMSQPVWNELDLSPIPKGEYVESDFWTQRGDALDQAGDKRRNRIRAAYQQAIAQRDFDKRTEAIYFDDLGVDMLLLDEGHSFKNLFAARNRFGEQPKFLGGSGLSNRAQDTYFKSRYVRERNDGNNVYMLTATPTKNSPLEIYSMLSHIAPEEFEMRGIRNSEDFLDRYCEFRTESILTVNGDIKESPVVTGFKNLDELREVMDRYIDRKTAEDVGLKLPKRNDSEHLIDMTPQQEAVYEELRADAEAAGNDAEAAGDAHIFSIMDKMGKASIDLELLGYNGARSPKLEKASDNIAKGAADGGQVVFADHIGVHDKIVDALVARGIKRNEIGVVNAKAANTSAKRQNISNKFNAGKLKVVVGNTATMGEGMNLQKATTDIHHLELPWEPASMQQRNGRGLRQGNASEAVRIHSYLAKGSFDGYRWQTLRAKKDWQDLLWNGGDKVENLAREGAFSREDMMIMLSADPEAAREKYQDNKAAALEKQRIAGTQAATQRFMKIQEMQRSYGKLDNKTSVGATRLKHRIERAKTKLASDKYFTAKDALKSSRPVAIQPETGHAWQAGTSFELAGGKAGPVHYSDEVTQWVVTAVDPFKGTVRARPYATLGNERVLTFDVAKMNAGVKPVEYSEERETATITQHVAQADQNHALAVTDPTHLRGTNEATLRELYTAIQRSITDAVKSYKSAFNGAVGVLDQSGKPVALKSYDVHNKTENHDFLLPLPEHRKKAIDAWMAMERAKGFHAHWLNRGRRQSVVSGVKSVYPGFEYGYYGGNPWSEIGNSLFGQDFERQARATLLHEQSQAAAKADTFTHAFLAMLPMASARYGGQPTFGSDALTALYHAAARHNVLDKPVRDTVPTHGQLVAGPMQSVPSGFFGSQGTVRSWLFGEAKQQKLYGTAAAMAMAQIGRDGYTPENAFSDLVGLRRRKSSAFASSAGSYEYPKPLLQAMNKLVNRYDLAERDAGGLRPQHDWEGDPIFNQTTRNKPIGQVLEEHVSG